MRWIVLEGIDGAGKTTFAKALEQLIKTTTDRLVIYRHIFDGEVGQILRSIFIENQFSTNVEVLLLATARAVYMEQVVLARDYDDYIIISDRFFDSILCMQGIRKACDQVLLRVLKTHIQGHIEPDLTV